jgi:hypothetical protein
MKLIFFIFIITFVFVNCSTPARLNGVFGNGWSMEFKFNNKSKFEYFFRGGESGVSEYSAGSIKRDNTFLYLSGFNKTNLQRINVENFVTDNKDLDRRCITIHYATDEYSSFFKTILVINDDREYMITKDTVLHPFDRIQTIQVKSYTSYFGLLLSSPTIDALYSPIIVINEKNNRDKNITLNFSVYTKDFYRIIFNDTLVVKNKDILYLKNLKLMKYHSQQTP